jgi:hypothetical protein
MTNGFDHSAFMAYLENNFNGFENSFLRETVGNIVDYGLKHERVSKDQFCYWVSDILPEISFGEVAMFMDDESLTANGKAEKQKALAENPLMSR